MVINLVYLSHLGMVTMGYNVINVCRTRLHIGSAEKSVFIFDFCFRLLFNRFGKLSVLDYN